MKRRLSLIERQEHVRAREAVAKKIEEGRLARVQARFDQKLARLREREARERARMRQEVQDLRREVGLDGPTRKIVVMPPALREMVRNFRSTRAWPIRSVARYFMVTSRQVRLIEGPQTTIEMLESTINRIVRRLESGRPPTPEEHAEFKARRPGRAPKVPKVRPESVILPGEGPVRLPNRKEVWLSMQMREQIKSWRIRNSLTIKQMGKRARVHKGAILQIEGPREWISMYTSTLIKILELMGRQVEIEPVAMVPRESVPVVEPVAAEDGEDGYPESTEDQWTEF